MPGRLGQGCFSDAELAALLAPLARHARIGLAVSGGPDSLGLMLMATRWARQTGGPDMIVYTLDHGLRPEAAEEAKMVAREASALGLAARVLRWDGDKPVTGVQAAARTARYRLIGEAMRADDASALVTAHHIEDQAETVLMRLAHGSGLTGLGGMEADTEIEGVRVLRPLLGVSRTRLAAEVAAAGLVAASDPGNSDIDYERVRWRQALPGLAAMGLTPERLALFARRAADANVAIESDAIEAAAQMVSSSGGVVRLRFDLYRQLSDAVAVRLLSRMIEAVSGRAPQLAQAEKLHSELRSLAAFNGRTLGGAVIERTMDEIAIGREPLTGARARGMAALTQGPAEAGQTSQEASHIAEIAQSTGGAPPLYRQGAGPTFGPPSHRLAAAGTPGQD